MMLILHVEDSDTSRKMFAAQTIGLRPRVSVVQCINLAEARAFLKTRQPELAILDVSLPDGTGSELQPLLRCPIIFVTADPSTAPSGHHVVTKGARWIRSVLALMNDLVKR